MQNPNRTLLLRISQRGFLEREKNRLREKRFLFKITPGCDPSSPHPAIRQIVQKGVTLDRQGHQQYRHRH
jgi:hypothetical protein